MLVNATTPDGNQVGADGKRIQARTEAVEVDYSGTYSTSEQGGLSSMHPELDTDVGYSIILKRTAKDTYDVECGGFRMGGSEKSVKVKNGKMTAKVLNGNPVELDLSTWMDGYIVGTHKNGSKTTYYRE